jgi:hypothetical protein
MWDLRELDPQEREIAEWPLWMRLWRLGAIAVYLAAGAAGGVLIVKYLTEWLMGV